MFGKLILCVFTFICLNGCATINTVTNAKPDSPIFFSGTRLDTNALLNNNLSLKKFTVQAPEYPLLDLPASFIADLFISPLTGGVALYETIFE